MDVDLVKLTENEEEIARENTAYDNLDSERTITRPGNPLPYTQNEKRSDDSDVQLDTGYPSNYIPGPPGWYTGYGGQMQQQQQNVVIQQPQMSQWSGRPMAPLENPPYDYLGYSIFVTICCCWVIGIFAIIKSVKCRSAVAARDRATAEAASRGASITATAALITGLIVIAISVAVAVFRIMNTTNNHHP